MPTYEFCHQITECNHEWEEWLNMSSPNPIHCPKCNAEGNITKLISLGSKGVVELYGNELVAKLKEDGKQLQRDAAKNETVYADLLGHDKMESLTKRMDQQNKIRRSK
jgi:putative FmdB family regulatory protein